MLADYVGGKAEYLYDDDGKRGGLADGSHFVIAGDLNADPIDGASHDGAAAQLLSHPAINAAQKAAAGQSSRHCKVVKTANRRGIRQLTRPTLVIGRLGTCESTIVCPRKRLK